LTATNNTIAERAIAITVISIESNRYMVSTRTSNPAAPAHKNNKEYLRPIMHNMDPRMLNTTVVPINKTNNTYARFHPPGLVNTISKPGTCNPAPAIPITNPMVFFVFTTKTPLINGFSG